MSELNSRTISLLGSYFGSIKQVINPTISYFSLSLQEFGSRPQLLNETLKLTKESYFKYNKFCV